MYSYRDSYGNSPENAETMLIGRRKRGVINYDGDKDFFQVTAGETGKYELLFEGMPNIVVNVYDSKKNLLSEGIDGSKHISYDLAKGETYYLGVSKKNSQTIGWEAGNYEMRFNQIRDDYGNNFAEAKNIRIGKKWFGGIEGSLSGKIDYTGDVDCFTFTAKISGLYNLEMNNSNAGIHYSLYDENTKSMGFDNKQTPLYLEEGKTYYLKASGENGVVGTYEGSIKFLRTATDDYGNSQEQAQKARIGQEIKGKVDYTGDMDYFSFTADSTGWYQIATTGNKQNLTYSIKDTNGNIPQINNDKPNIINVYFNQGQTYYAEVKGEQGAEYTGTISKEARHRFNIKFDYRYDATGFFDDPERRKNLEYAASLWSDIISDDFATIGAGTKVIGFLNPLTGNRDTITLDQSVDDLLIFVGARDLAGVQTDAYTLAMSAPSGADQGEPRYFSQDFEPWVGSITFDTKTNWFFDSTIATSDDITKGSMDFIRVATHEIGHVLGIGPSPAFQRLIDKGGNFFMGENAITANGGNWVSVDKSKTHLSFTDFSDDLMSPYSNNGLRLFPSEIDKGILKDLGYKIV